jgi:hypothetical protein
MYGTSFSAVQFQIAQKITKTLSQSKAKVKQEKIM